MQVLVTGAAGLSVQRLWLRAAGDQVTPLAHTAHSGAARHRAFDHPLPHYRRLLASGSVDADADAQAGRTGG